MTHTTTAAVALPGWTVGAVEQIRDTADLLASDPDTADVDQIRAVAQTLLTILVEQHAARESTPHGVLPFLTPVDAAELS